MNYLLCSSIVVLLFFCLFGCSQPDKKPIDIDKRITPPEPDKNVREKYEKDQEMKAQTPPSDSVNTSLSDVESEDLKNQFDINKFAPIPPAYHIQRASLYNKIIPDSNYDYWEVRFLGKIETYKGDRSKYSSVAKQYKCNSGFFAECAPGVCYTSIVALKNGKAKFVCNEKDLQSFIGRIDNLEEALLIAKTHNLWFDEKDKRGGAYIKTKDGYLLYLLDYSSTPVTYNSVETIINKNGYLKVINKQVYYEDENEYIVE